MNESEFISSAKAAFQQAQTNILNSLVKDFFGPQWHDVEGARKHLFLNLNKLNEIERMLCGLPLEDLNMAFANLSVADVLVTYELPEYLLTDTRAFCENKPKNSNNKLKDLVYKTNPFLKMIPKDNSFKGAPIYVPIPISYSPTPSGDD